ncbi:hypothetical protein NDU88_000889, partial [Pleurodeles waltl]
SSFSQQIPQEAIFSHDLPSRRPTPTQPGGFYDILRSPGRIFPHSHSPQSSEILTIQG